jgi:hypothetical protein
LDRIRLQFDAKLSAAADRSSTAPLAWFAAAGAARRHKKVLTAPKLPMN